MNDTDNSYSRYLLDSDYYALTSPEHFRQLLGGIEGRIELTERMAENKVMGFLDQYYEVRKELEKGKAWVSEGAEGDDPRNGSLVGYMSMISLYYLHAVISPANISVARKEMFEEAINWLSEASKLRIDPHIRRRIDPRTRQPKDDWALSAFETNMDTIMRNPWVI